MGDSYTIQISTKLINQLAKDEEKSKRKIKKPKKPKPQNDQNTPKPKPEPPQTQNPNPQPTWPHLYLPVPAVPVQTPELDSIRTTLKESEKVLEKLNIEESKMLEELNKRAKELREKEFKLPYQKQVPCLKERSDCLDCYKNNAKDPLKCAEFVKRFADCARKSRQ